MSPHEVLTHNPAIGGKIKTLTGQDAQLACNGFKNLGGCVSAAHVANNLGIPFDVLKSKVTGTNALSLGKAIQELKPQANKKAEMKKAKKQSAKDFKES